MNLSPIDLFVQEKILLAVHKGCTIEEAREKEIKKNGCIVSYSMGDGGYEEGYGSTFIEAVIFEGSLRDYTNGSQEIWKNEDSHMGGYIIGGHWNDACIIGLPPTLSRVLHALGDDFGFFGGWINIFYRGTPQRKTIWKKINDDGTDATFRDQSEQTKFAIGKLLGQAK